MSGGHFNYLYARIGNDLNFDPGHYGINEYSYYAEEVKAARASNVMNDKDLSEMMYDITCLLHSLEWYESGDIGESGYMHDVETFKRKWFFRNSEQVRQAYKEDMRKFLREELERLG